MHTAQTFINFLHLTGNEPSGPLKTAYEAYKSQIAAKMVGILDGEMAIVLLFKDDSFCVLRQKGYLTGSPTDENYSEVLLHLLDIKSVTAEERKYLRDKMQGEQHA